MEPQKNSARRFRSALARFWLAKFFWLCDAAPSVLTAARPLICAAVFIFSPSVRRGTRANARRLLPPDSTRRQRRQLAWRTLNNFYLVCCDIGKSRHYTVEQLLGLVESVQGREIYLQARAQHKGVIVATAHMGSFEVALAALRSMEEHVHVLFRRDAIDEFDRQRSNLRRRLGVHEVPVDEGWTIWIKLRQVLLEDQVVVIQADRVLSGQKGQLVPFLGGQMEIPFSPIKLALASGSPIIPVFSIRTPAGKIRIQVEEPIHVTAISPTNDNPLHRALLELARVLERQLIASPDQWLLLEPAWHQDSCKHRPD
jgi:lauroyl/myristoyl acyltransferase